ncbi:phage head-tail connector protein [Clostridium sp. AWRP]|uniref:phage head-tail connector protein n=1 Tax=Clostridium sp. AWRP TaxID=2212991 RepID=UPI000FD837B0|nr:phage head-tail connector protein [Clostridium sp. AWRP]AZV57930.1 hypothetical protein DMR38_15685 [Clostridium sp. AWRP]
MLENIKDILEIQDDSKDKIISEYIEKVTQKVLNYCNIKSLPKKLEEFVEDKVISIIQYKLKNSNNKEVKSIQRGDTRIEYEASSEKDERILLSFEADEMRELNNFRKVVW